MNEWVEKKDTASQQSRRLEAVVDALKGVRYIAPSCAERRMPAVRSDHSVALQINAYLAWTSANKAISAVGRGGHDE